MSAANSELDQLADRHLRLDPQGVLVDAAYLKSGVVLLRAGSHAASVATQHLLWMLVSLLARQFKVVTEVILDVPDVPLRDGVAPFGAMATLRETLEECVRLVSGPHVQITPLGAREPDVILVVGDATDDAPHYLRLYADGWRYFLGRTGQVPKSPPGSTLAIGPYLCASYAAGEVFKRLRGMKPGKGEFISNHFASAWTASNADTWAELRDGPPADAFDVLPHFYFAGAGAVAQAAALCLGASGFRGSCTIVDRDALDLTNDNRYALSHKGNEGALKVDLLSEYLAGRGFRCNPVRAWWQEFVTMGGRRAIDDTVRALERAYQFPLVLSCVDKNEPRHALQNLLPMVIVGGSTDGLTAKSALIDLSLPGSCLKCFNPVEARNEIVQQRIKELQGLAPSERAAYAAKMGWSEQDVHLLLQPGACGKLSAGDIDRFAAGSPEMSVGFVSAAAGVLLVTQMLRYLHLGPAAATTDGATVIATFARARLRLMKSGPDHACDCGARLREQWRALWTEAERQGA